LREGWGRLSVWWGVARRRRSLRPPDVRHLNDRALRDIGLTRGDVERDPANTFWRP
jgi:uncharacterized protein YjiS (DUF1127 family)